jgi:hypothetical protein
MYIYLYTVRNDGARLRIDNLNLLSDDCYDNHQIEANELHRFLYECLDFQNGGDENMGIELKNTDRNLTESN